MNTIKLTEENIKLFETLGNSTILGARKATFIPYILVQHNHQPADEFELIHLPTVEEWEDYKRLTEPNLSDVV